MDETPLDRAEDGLPFYNIFVSAELFLLLNEEPKGDDIRPEVFATEEGRFVLAFDREDRMAQFVGRPAAHVALPGRALAEMLEGQGIGIALNPDVAPSSQLIPAEAVDWMVEAQADDPEERADRIDEIAAPNVPEALLVALDAKLAGAVGAAPRAYLVATQMEDGARGHLLAFVGAAEGAEAGLAQAVSEALAFSGLEAASLDVGFFDAIDPMSARLAVVGLRFDLPQHAAPQAPGAPGMDPDRPPKLR